jgi:hypothetical protein
VRPISAQQATATALCKVRGCPLEALSALGRYAKLCEAHRREARERHRAIRRLGTPPAGVSIAELAGQLVPIAEWIDRALDGPELTDGEACRAVAAWVRQLQACQLAISAKLAALGP